MKSGDLRTGTLTPQSIWKPRRLLSAPAYEQGGVSQDLATATSASPGDRPVPATGTTYLPLLEQVDQVLVVARPQSQVVDQQQHAQGVLVGLQASGGSGEREAEGDESHSGPTWCRGPVATEHAAGRHSPQDELAVLQRRARAAPLLQEAHLLVQGQVEAPRPKTVPVSRSGSRRTRRIAQILSQHACAYRLHRLSCEA